MSWSGSCKHWRNANIEPGRNPLPEISAGDKPTMKGLQEGKDQSAKGIYNTDYYCEAIATSTAYVFKLNYEPLFIV
ncbi:hypothetical protein ACN38_g11615, partial [Penicillium nordicum]